jgi:hypothetical protein
MVSPTSSTTEFWPQLGQEVAAVLQDAFISQSSPALPTSLLEGGITLLYKGKGVPRSQPASYRPITLLNKDCSGRSHHCFQAGTYLDDVIDPTRTSFLPGRWIGNNVLAHLEEISYYEDTQLPGVILFLDFEKAFDRMDRGWIERCMSTVGFGPGMQ